MAKQQGEKEAPAELAVPTMSGRCESSGMPRRVGRAGEPGLRPDVVGHGGRVQGTRLS